MPTVKKRGPSRRGQGLTDDMICDLICGSGFLNAVDPFTTPEERREAWEHYRDLVMAQIGDTGLERFLYGNRPQAWWEYDLQEKQPGGIVEEYIYLRDHNLLLQGEDDKVLPEMKEAARKYKSKADVKMS